MGVARRHRGELRARVDEAITRLQKAEQRYFQRPDVTFVALDPTATSLAGWNGQANLNRNSGNFTVNLGIWGMSPGLEVNDAGYSTQTDRAGAHALLQYRKLTPDRWTSERTFWVSKWWTWNWGSQCQGGGWQANATIRFSNMWRTSALFTYAKRVWDDKLTRGGPTVIRPGNRGNQLAVATDSRKKAVLSLVPGQAAAPRSAAGPQQVDAGLRQRAPALGAVRAGLRAAVVQMPGAGSGGEEVPLPQQALLLGLDGDRPVPVAVRLGQVPLHEGGGQTAPVARSRGLPADLRADQGRPVHDVKIAQRLQFAPGSIVVMDRGYNDYRLFGRLTAAGGFIVTRLKSNAGFEFVRRLSTAAPPAPLVGGLILLLLWVIAPRVKPK